MVMLFQKSQHKCYAFCSFAGRGNETPTGEYNFTCDPEAASVVLSEAECKTRIVTYEPCQEHVLDWVS